MPSETTQPERLHSQDHRKPVEPAISEDQDMVYCDRCSGPMFRMRAVYWCDNCGYKTDCCGH